jgi:glutathione synthase/RimK-type ligase-like ATP-grasp enzyme
MERRCIALIERLGLNNGAIDLILTPDGRHVFLEVNPTGQWQWIDHLTGLPIANAVCDFLAGDMLAAELPDIQSWSEPWKNVPTTVTARA